MEYNKNQLKAINHYKGNCCVLASAGSGKTTVLVDRITNLINNHSVESNKILALTFSKKAVLNMTNKLNNSIPNKNNNVNIFTFHALGYAILKEKGFYYDIIKEWEKRKLINDICVKSLGLESDEIDVPANDILNFIAYQKNHLVKPTDEFINIESPYKKETIRDIYTLYEKHKTKIDFEDMLLKSYDILLNYKYNIPYEFICVDEFQDTNKAQYEIAKLLNIHNNLFVVGDGLQNIYEWRGSNNNYLINFYKDWSNSKVIPLNINYRSTNNIVIYSNNLMKNTLETTHKHYIESVSNKDKYKNPIINTYENETEESTGICNTIKELTENNNYDYKDIAILTRTNFQMQVIERSLYHNNIPYNIVDGNKFYELKEIKDILSYLRLIKDTSNNEAFLNIYNTPNRYLGNVFINKIKLYAKKYNLSLFDSMQEFPRSNEWRYKKGIDELSKLIYSLQNKKKYSVGKMIKNIRVKLDYDKYISKDGYENNDRNEKIDNLDALMNIAYKYKDIGLFLDEIDNMLGVNNDNANNVLLMTIHKSKGLEFPVVFVAGVSNGLLPHKKSNNINEEKRLLYVATTRAEKELFISSVETYYDKYLGVSDFLIGIDGIEDCKKEVK
ncbi:MAG: ATP-dependent helicase [Prolixibacteraceae bacterium]|nr:ATP-dependent helicase [Prolixibacteraceae bacterium]